MEAEPWSDENTSGSCEPLTSLGVQSSDVVLSVPQVMDVAQALANLMPIPQLSGTLSLPGPSTLTYEYLLDLVSSVTLQPPSRAPVLPKAVASVLAKAAQSVWWPTLSPDEVTRRYIDDADVPGDWEAVGMTQPSEIEHHAITYLRRYRSAYVILVSFSTKLLNAISGRTLCDQSCFPHAPQV